MRYIFLIFIASILSLMFYAKLLLGLSGYYYGVQDYFGPLSVDWRVTVLLFTFIIMSSIIMVLATNNSNHSLNRYFAGSLILLMILAKYVLPDVADTNYAMNFYDAGGHIVRGVYVAATGHSNPKIDSYFDLQPGFFWVTAILLDVICKDPLSGSAIAFLVKWFHIVAIILYLPILYFLFRTYNLNAELSLLGIFIALTFDYGRSHYSAAAYGLALYWLLLALLPKVLFEQNRSWMISAFTVMLAIVFVHQGIALATLVTLMAVFIYALATQARKLVSTSPVKALNILILFLIVWLIYLIHTAVTFEDFIHTLRAIILEYLSEGATNVAGKGIERPYIPWMRIVYFKAVYFATIIASSIILLFLRASKDRAGKPGIVFFVVLAVSFTIGGIAVPLGAGYIERIPIWLLPFISYAFVTWISEKKGIFKGVAVALITILMLAGTIIYFSGRNFQSICYSEQAHGFVLDHDPSRIVYYSTVKVTSTQRAIQSIMHGEMPRGLVAIDKHDIIQSLYYLVGDEELLERYLRKLISDGDILYNSPTSLLLQL